jgi:hypothetical protein
MDFLHSLLGFMWGMLIFVGPWAAGIYLVSRMFASIKLLNQTVIDLQQRVKQLEGKRKN